MKTKKIVVAGHLCVDITPKFLMKEAVKDVREVFKPGSLLNVGAASNNVGGVVANTGLALKKFGSDVVLIGKIAEDSFGQIIKNTFKEYGCAEYLINAENESTSYTMVIAPKGIDRMFLHHMGTNATFSYEDLDFELIAKADHFHFGYPPLMRNMYLNNAEETIKILKKVKSLGLTTSLDMAAVDEGTEVGEQDWTEVVKNVVPYVDFFVPSIEELGYMMDKNLYHEWNERADGQDVTTVLDLEKDVKPLADQLMEWGAKCVLIKCGAAGMYLHTAPADIMETIDPQFKEWDSLSIFEKSYVPDCILSGTGAGDTSIAAFLKASLEGYPVERCLQLATGTGASCITAYDALSGLLSFEELIAKIDGGWEKNK